jgi:hypothetical protein
MNKTSAKLVAYLATLKLDYAWAARSGERGRADYLANEVASVGRACKAVGIPDWLLGRVSRVVREVEGEAFVVLPDAAGILAWWREGEDAAVA